MNAADEVSYFLYLGTYANVISSCKPSECVHELYPVPAIAYTLHWPKSTKVVKS